MKRWAILKSNYVIDVILWDGITPYQYPFDHDTMLEDLTYNVGIGDWYESSEQVYYRPLSAPPDFPPQ
jgi:hypothetical protein